MLPGFETPGTRGSNWLHLHARSNGFCIKKEDWLKTALLRDSADKAHLTNEEIRDIEILLRALHDAPYWHCNILSLSPNSIGDTVELSDERKTYFALFSERGLLPENEEDWNEETVKELQTIRVLGEYKDGTIILYINNIKDIASEKTAPGFYGMPYLTVTRYVYLHELMHAFFDRKENEGYEYNREEEEGFAEFGALLLLEQLVNTTPEVSDYMTTIPEVNHATREELAWAIRHVEEKKGVLKCYSRGADLFKQYGQDKELSRRMLEAYPKPVE